MAIYIAAFNLAVLFAPIDILLSFWDVVGESGLHALQSEIPAEACTSASLLNPPTCRFLCATLLSDHMSGCSAVL